MASFLSARQSGGVHVLRIEDLDTARTALGATQAMLADLRWLGIDWDEGPDIGGPFAPYVQSERFERYFMALKVLTAVGIAYPCSCSRRDVELASQAPHAAEPVYPGTCRDRDPHEVAAEARARGRGLSWRFSVAEAGVINFHDRLRGEIAQNVTADVGDFVIFRADGVPAYQLAVVVDDVAMNITEVVRGDDLLSSTARQVLLYRALHAAVPSYLHVPLVVGDDGVRLAKRHGSISIDALRERGVEPIRLQKALIASLSGEFDGDLKTARLDPARIPTAAIGLQSLRRWLPEIG